MVNNIVCKPVTPDRWEDLVDLFGARGACGGCWCMYWRVSKSRFDAEKGEQNKQHLKELIAGGTIPGLLAYEGDVPVGWLAVQPREAYPRMDNSRILRPVDDLPVWSVTCFFTRKEFRRQGVSIALLEAAKEYARSSGATILEGYPVDSAGTPAPAPFVWTGLASAFRKAGFREVARRSPKRPVMRFVIDENAKE